MAWGSVSVDPGGSNIVYCAWPHPAVAVNVRSPKATSGLLIVSMLIPNLRRRQRRQRQRVDARLELFGQRGIDAALALDAAHAFECVRDDAHGEMGLAARPVACMALMTRALVGHFERNRREVLCQFLANGVGHRHGPAIGA